MKKNLILILLIVFAFSCRQLYVPQDIAYSQTHIDSSYLAKDTLIESLIIPYRNTLKKSMDKVIATATTDLVKAKPESTLGNLLADATLEETALYFNTKIDFAIMNYGGIRVPSINKGAITVGNVYELMPFDNYLGFVELNGPEALELLNRIAAGGGWPISGVQFTIKDNKAQNILINGEAFDFKRSYKVALSDYLATGGDNLDMIPPNSFQNTNILLRDAFLHYFEAKGNLSAQLENRITINE